MTSSQPKMKPRRAATLRGLALCLRHIISLLANIILQQQIYNVNNISFIVLALPSVAFLVCIISFFILKVNNSYNIILILITRKVKMMQQHGDLMLPLQLKWLMTICRQTLEHLLQQLCIYLMMAQH